jgi:hypothetical protein
VFLLLLVLLLLFGHPAHAAVTAASALGVLSVRGLPVIILLVARLLVTGIGVAAGITLAGRRAGAPVFAQAALWMSAVVSLITYLTPYFPNNRMPGDTPFYVAGSLIYHAAWIFYLRHSRLVRQLFSHARHPV